jgi:hypothetical protein
MDYLRMGYKKTAQMKNLRRFISFCLHIKA